MMPNSKATWFNRLRYQTGLYLAQDFDTSRSFKCKNTLFNIVNTSSKNTIENISKIYSGTAE